MRLAIINYSSSGMFHYAACLANELARQPEIEILFVTSLYNNLDLLPSRHNIHLLAQDAPHHLSGFFRWLITPAQQRQLYRATTRFKPDIIHLTDAHAAAIPHQWWLKRYPVLLTQHDPVSHSGDVYRWPSVLIHRTEQRLADHIVVHGQFLQDILVSRRHIPAGKISVIPHGDYSFYQRWRTPAVRLRNAVLFFGRIVDYKGLGFLLASLISLQREGLSVTLILAGPGNLTKYQAALDQLPHKIIDNRTIPEAEVIRYFDMSTLIALPYREASQSGIISIAMPAGLPIVATRVGALPEILVSEQNSLLVEPNNTSQLAAAIKRLLLNQALRARLAAGAKETVAKKIAWRHTAGQYQRLYRLLLRQL